ncbi:hypothetical protein JG687_00014369 [Phytophthora cactorum]|uniref:STAS domain-containing protein n=1 Tax=Phytophthora cactorum TaxID=29920 RepID=A0A329S0J1_9STRA|nr:hypothetical protein Pcac1_g18330 [Phytophthora cactorum]KAG6950258.1 hypothetical protein JG687_00014369 [Phytophthora cactorum]RAW30403.1 hypothetical protein PC110_g13241 [Phytophthora cactorum]
MLIAKETADPTSLQARQHFALDARSPLPGRVTGFAMAPSASPPSPSSDELSLSCLGALLSSLWTSACETRQNITRQRLLFFLKQHVPILEWLPSYDIREDLQFDLVSGITVGLMLVPQEVSLSAIMGVPPIYGLYTAAVVPMIYPLFGTSRVLSVANGAEVSLLVGSAIKKVESEEERIATGILLSFLSGVVLLFMGVFRLGVIADFFSRPVMGGFISAGGVLIMLSQVASWWGLDVKSRDLPVLTVWDLFQHFPELNGLSFAVGTFSIMVLVGMHELKRRVVKELARVEEEFEDQFAIETSRALTQLSMSVNSAGGEQGDMSEDDEDSQGAKDDRRAASYEGDIELGDAPKPKKRQPRKNDDEVDVEGVSVSPRGSRWADLPAVFTTGSLRRRDYVLSSPWGSSGRNSRDLGSNDLDLARSCRQRDLAAITRNNRNGRLDDEGVGFSLSDEDYITIERPLDFGTRPDGAGASGMPRSSSDETGSARPLPRMNPTQPKVERPRRNDNNADNDDDSEAKADAEMKRRVKELASPAKSDTGSESDSTTALTGRMMAASSTSIRLLRSKMAVLIALRLVCDLGAFMVCLLGGIVGYLAPEGSLNLAGDVPGGYPAPKRPWYGFSENIIDADRLYHLFIDTLSIAIISYMCSVAMAKRLAIKEGYRIRPNQELIALGFSNLVGSFFQGMPSTGGLSRTAVNMQNARTQLASVITVLVVVLVLYTATSALAYLPKASLASIIIVAGYSLIELKEAKWLYRVKRDEFYVWLASFVLSCLLGVLPGLLSSIFCSLIAVIYKTRRPTVSMLGEVTDEETGENRIVELDMYPDTARPFSDVVVIRVEGALYFANCEYIERVVEREVRKRHETEDVAVLGVVIDAGSIMDWDTTTIQMMKHLKAELRGQGIMLAIVNARDRLQQLLRTSEFLVGIVHNDARIGFTEAIKAIREEGMPLDESQALTRSSRVHSI